MGNIGKGFDPAGIGWMQRTHYRVSHSAEDTNRYVVAGDLNAASVGTKLTLAQNHVPFHSIAFTQTDALSSGLSVTYKVTGYNHLGNLVTESLTLTDTETKNTKYAWQQIEEIEITAITGAATSDTIDVGVSFNIATSLGRFGVPEAVTKIGDITCLNLVTAGSGEASIGGFLDAYKTFEVPQSASRRDFIVLIDPKLWHLV